MADADYWNELQKTAVEAILGKINAPEAIHITPESHPAFHESVAALAKKAGLNTTPSVLVVENMPNAPVWLRKAPNGGASPYRVVLLNKSMMDLTGADVSKSMSADLETVMAHEFSHLKDGPARMLAQFGLPVVLPVISVAALKLYDRARGQTKPLHDENKKAYAERLTEVIHEVADDEIGRTRAPENTAEWHLDPDWKKRVIHESRTLLVAAVGLAAGLLGSRHLSLKGEFRADRRAVEMTANPEALKSVLTRLSMAHKEFYNHKPPLDSLDKVVKDKLHWLVTKTVAAHPGMKERLAHIDSVGGMAR